MMLPCEAVADRRVETLQASYVGGQISHKRYIEELTKVLDLLAEAGLIPDEPKEAR